MAEEYHGLHEKLVDRFGTKGDALYIFFACLLALGVSGLAAYAFKQPLLFPSLGLLQTPLEMAMLMLGVVILTVVGWSINRALGVPMSVWSARE